MGGVESHIYQLAQELILMGHKVLDGIDPFNFDRKGCRNYPFLRKQKGCSIFKEYA